eukprot:2851333-Pleurochrysis_carterae.AAC.1
MDWARTQMKTWIVTKNDEHKANVQRRWDNRGKMNKAFQTWRKRVTKGTNLMNRRREKKMGMGD